MHDGNGHERMSKTFPVFDCDAHINDPDTIWTQYVEPAYRELIAPDEDRFLDRDSLVWLLTEREETIIG